LALSQARVAKYRHSHGGALLPDSLATPGAVETSDTAIVCHRSTKTVRNVPQSRKDSAFTLYGIKIGHYGSTYEIDHLISLELGGSNDLANLWPEPATPIPGYHQKDWVENYLHRIVCEGKISLDSAQHQIARDWTVFYSDLGK
jgi:hypothetical protein